MTFLSRTTLIDIEFLGGGGGKNVVEPRPRRARDLLSF